MEKQYAGPVSMPTIKTMAASVGIKCVNQTASMAGWETRIAELTNRVDSLEGLVNELLVTDGRNWGAEQ